MNKRLKPRGPEGCVFHSDIVSGIDREPSNALLKSLTDLEAGRLRASGINMAEDTALLSCMGG